MTDQISHVVLALVGMRRSVNMVYDGSLKDMDLVRAFRAGSVRADAEAMNGDQER